MFRVYASHTAGTREPAATITFEFRSRHVCQSGGAGSLERPQATRKSPEMGTDKLAVHSYNPSRQAADTGRQIHRGLCDRPAIEEVRQDREPRPQEVRV